jgi:hypothetical protein
VSQIADAGSAEIVISRDDERDIKMRGLEIYIDDLFVYDLGYERTYRAKLKPGAHTVKVSNHLYKKKIDLDLKPGDTVNLNAGNRFTLLGGLMVAILGMGPYKVFLEEAPPAAG